MEEFGHWNTWMDKISRNDKFSPQKNTELSMLSPAPKGPTAVELFMAKRQLEHQQRYNDDDLQESQQNIGQKASASTTSSSADSPVIVADTIVDAPIAETSTEVSIIAASTKKTKKTV